MASYEFEEGELGRVILPYGNWMPEHDRALMREDGAIGIRFSSDWKCADCSFLASYPNLKYLSMSVPFTSGFEVFERLGNLVQIVINYPQTQSIPFASLARLRVCGLCWTPAMKDLWNTPSLKVLSLGEYKGKTAKDISQIKTLQNLELSNSPLSDFGDLYRLGDLRFLGVYYHRKMETLEDIALVKTLEVLAVEACKKITRLDPLVNLKRLRVLSLTNMGEIESLGPLGSLTNLEEVYFFESTRILDGDLSVLKSLPKLRRVGFNNRRSYSHRLEDFPPLISTPFLKWIHVYDQDPPLVKFAENPYDPPVPVQQPEDRQRE